MAAQAGIGKVEGSTIEYLATHRASDKFLRMSEETLNNTTENLKKALERIGSGLLDSEAQTKQSVITPILRGLGWDDTNPHEVRLEYPLLHSATGKVDYALCGPAGKPLVFVEAKRLGNANKKGESQLSGYAYEQGVPLLILTDGKTWNFYLSMAEGVISDRRFYRTVLTELEKAGEYAKYFVHYLDKARVVSGEAAKDAQKDLSRNLREEQVRQAKPIIPKGWRTLLDAPDPELRSLLATAVEKECGIEPAQSDLDNFLREQLQPPSQPASLQLQTEPALPMPPASFNKNDRFRPLGYNDSVFYYWNCSQGQIVELVADKHSKQGLTRIAPISFWTTAFPGKQQKADWDKAAEAMMEACEQKGVFDSGRVRGRGCWLEDNEIVVHTGNSIINGGNSYQVGDFPSKKYIYVATEDIPGPIKPELSDDESEMLVKLAESFSWEIGASAALLCGWVVLAPVCGALAWRPHIWLTGRADKAAILEQFIKPLLGNTDLHVQGNSTATGIRQTLRTNALPVLFQGDDSEEQQVRPILALVRESSTEDGAKTLKGTHTGRGENYLMRSMFCLSGKLIGTQADRTGIFDLSLAENSTVGWSKVNANLTQINDDADFGRRLIRRTINHFPILQENIKTFRRVAGQHFNDQIRGDQYGALLAGCYSLISRKPVLEEKAKEFILKFDWDSITESAKDNEAEDLLRSIMQLIVVSDKDRDPYSVGSALGMIYNDESASTDLKYPLQHIGVKLNRDNSFICIANNNVQMDKMLQGVRNAGSIRQFLMRIPGAEQKLVRFGVSQQRATRIPVSEAITLSDNDDDDQ